MKKYKYTPDYPKTTKDALEMLREMYKEAEDEIEVTEFLNGYKMGLRIGINFLEIMGKALNKTI